MPTALQFRRGTTTQNNSFTGAVGEISVDTTLDTLRIHDGSAAGGFEITQNAAAQTLTNKTLTTPVIAEIDSGSTITLDATTDIVLDADGGDIFFKDAGTTFGSATNTGGNLIIKSGTTTAATFSGANVTLAGTVASGAITSSSTVTATQGIFSNASPLIFEGNTADSFETTIAVTDPTADRTLTLPNATDTLVGRATTDTLTNKTLTTPVIAEIDNAGSITLDAGADIVLDADGADVVLKDGGTTYGALNNNGGELRIQSGSSPTTAITMSGANVTIAGNLTVSGSTTTIDSSTVSVTNSFTFEGATADSFETTLAVEDPTADRTVTIPNATTQLVGRDTTDTLTNKTLTTPVIAEIDSGAAITLDATTDIILDADGDNITMKAAGTTVLDFVLNGATDVTLDAPGDIKIDADGGDVLLLDAGSQFGSLTNNSNNLIIKSGTTTAATFSGANTTLAGTLGSGAITSSSTVTATGFVNTGTMIFEGSTADSFETTLGAVDPTADRSVNIANVAGTLQPFAAASTDQITATPAEINLIDGGTARGTTAIADGDGVLINDAGTMRMTTVETLAAYLDDEITAMPNLVGTGALNSGTITSGFGNIDTGSSTITTTGLISGGSLDIDDVLINGTTIGHTDDTDLITLADGIATVAGEISVTTLDIGGTNVTTNAAEINLIDGGTARGTDALADGDGILINDAGTMKMTNVTAVKTYMQSGLSTAYDDFTAGDAAVNITTTSGNITIDAQGNDTDIIFKGTDGSSDTTFLTIDGSAAGAAAFNDAVTATSFTSTGASTFDGVNITEDGTIVFEGASNNSFETTLTVTDPTADRTITFPNETFKVASYANKATLDGDGSDTTISVAAGYDVDQFFVTINGIVQEPTEDFTYSGSTITLDAAPVSGDRVVVRY